MQSQLAYVECKNGICGSMFLGALLDLHIKISRNDKNDRGASQSDEEERKREQDLIAESLLYLNLEFEKIKTILPKSAYDILFEYQLTYGIRTGFFSVLCNTTSPHVSTSHTKNNYKRIRSEIEQSELSASVKEFSLRIFKEIALAEKKIHEMNIDKIHFHEVGAIDSIIDIIGSALLVERLNLVNIRCSTINVGDGHISTQHGQLPVPAPATCELLKSIPITSSHESYELCTPTGAALVRIYAKSFGSLPPMRIQEIGYGAGSHNLQRPNIVRIFLGNSDPSEQDVFPTILAPSTSQRKSISPSSQIRKENLITLSMNIDDMTPEKMAQLVPLCMEAGAMDCWILPILMKKGRMAHQLNVLCKRTQRHDFMNLLFENTTTLGIRVQVHSRFSLRKRETRLYNTDRFGPIQFKISEWNGKKKAKPEYSSIRKLHREHPAHSFSEIFEYAEKWIQNTLGDETSSFKFNSDSSSESEHIT